MRVDPSERDLVADEEPSEPAEPTQSQARIKRPGEGRATRMSSPSAFGLPRPNLRSTLTPLPPQAAEERAERAPAAAPAALSEDVPLHEQPLRAPVVDSAPPPLAATAALHSLAPPTRADALLDRPPPGPHRRLKLSLGLFAGMLLLSGVSLHRYLGDREAPAGDAKRSGQPAPDHTAAPAGEWSAPQAAAITTQRVAESDDVADAAAEAVSTLVADATRALTADDLITAERLFARVLELDPENPRTAYGMARIRLAQGNLSGAEGWIQQAIKRRPRRAAYHALYAEILERLGNARAAQEERALGLGEGL